MTLLEAVKEAQPYVPAMMARILLGTIGLVLSAGTARWLWEELYLTRWKNRHRPDREHREVHRDPIEWRSGGRM
jgi:hypothetical protein